MNTHEKSRARRTHYWYIQYVLREGALTGVFAYYRHLMLYTLELPSTQPMTITLGPQNTKNHDKDI